MTKKGENLEAKRWAHDENRRDTIYLATSENTARVVKTHCIYNLEIIGKLSPRARFV